MKTTYKVTRITNRVTYISEFWDDIQMYKYKVYAVYNGGDILDFMLENNVVRHPEFNGINEYHRRTFILDL